MKRSLQVKMVLIMTLLAVSLMLVVGTLLVNNVTGFYHDDFLRQMRSFFNQETLSELASLAKTAADTGLTGQELQQRQAQALLDRIGVFASQLGIDSYRNFYIFDMQGHCVAGSNPELAQGLELTPNLLSAMEGKQGDTLNVSMRYMDYAVALGDYAIYIKDSKDEVRDLTWEIVLIIIETMFVTLIIAILLSFLLARTITNPIEKLTEGALRVAEGGFDPIAVSSDDEIGTLTDTFNDMAQALQQTLGDIESQRSKFETIFLYLTDGVAVFDTRGVLTNVNRTAEEFLGGSLREGVTRFEDIFPEDLLDVRLSALSELGGQTLQKSLAGAQRTLQVTFADFTLPEQEAPGSGKGVIAVLHDVTEQQRLEASRREFIANVSHELRTPLTSIKSYTETVLEDSQMRQEDRDRFLSVVLAESDRMIRIVKDLLLLSRLDNDKLDLRMDRFSVAEMVGRVQEALRMDAAGRGHTLRVDMHEPGDMTGDAERIEQVLVNVVSNSIKYTPDGGVIEVEAHREGDTVIIAVKDNGIGIPQEDLERIFERFYRVDKARSRELGGTGLGLAIAQDIMKAHGGNIDIESALGVGSTVTLRLPAAQA